MIRPSERGAALLTVLMLVAIMAVISAGALEKLRLATRLAQNTNAVDQARAFGLAAETIAVARINTLVEADAARTTLAGGWNGRETRLPVPSGLASITVRDGGNCFNLNSVVEGEAPGNLAPRPFGIQQFVELAAAVGVNRDEARLVAGALADWIDSDGIPAPGGAEDAVYADRPVPYRTANTLLADPSELRAIAGVTPELYARLRPWICALPTPDLSPINVNTLSVEQAPLFVMLLPSQLDLPRARQLLAERPARGYESLFDFWRIPALDALTPSQEALGQTSLRTRWFELAVKVQLGDAELEERALIDARITPAKLVQRQWGEPS